MDEKHFYEIPNRCVKVACSRIGKAYANRQGSSRAILIRCLSDYYVFTEHLPSLEPSLVLDFIEGTRLDGVL